MADDSYRLGTAVVPELYRLRIDADMKRFTFSGEESISAKVTERSDRIVMNAYMLRIKEAYVSVRNRKIMARPVVDDKKQRLTLLLEESVIGKVEIHIRFDGKAGEKMVGLYRSEYMERGKKVNILTTQFESLYARQAFPCFDEPELKAAFELTLSADKDYNLVSNMPARSTTVSKGRKVSEFMRTPVMSTYLLYMGVLKHASTSTTYRGIRINILSAPAYKEYMELPLEYTVKALRFYENYFGIEYPLPKLDIIAIPDFAASAMENWGAITFREKTLLVKESSPVPDRQYTAMVIAHELAHQWFGDLVTMRWWNDIWLNESFAEFMAYKATAELFPEFHMDLEFLFDTIDVGLNSDDIKSTHPIEAVVRDPMDMDRAFDNISYRKGGSVLSMMEDYVGKEKFRKGLHKYLKKHMYSNTVRDDLWDAIGSVAGSGLQVKRVADAWITKAGHPAIRVSSRNSIEQSRFILNNHRGDGKEVWPIPVTYATGSGKNSRVLFDRKRMDLKQASGWVKLNYGQKGFYRVFYENEDLMKLGALVKSGRLSWADGWGLENDLFILARCGEAMASDYMDFARLFSGLSEYPMAYSAMVNMRWIRNMLPEGHPLVKEIDSTCIDYSRYHLSRLGWTPKKGESSMETLMRRTSILIAGVSGYGEAVSRAQKLFSAFKDRGIEIDPEIRSAVLTVVAINGDARLYAWFKKKYISEMDPGRKREYLLCLGAFREKEVISDVLDFSMSSAVRDQDKFYIPTVVAGNPVGRRMIWGWTKKNWKSILKRFEVGNHMPSRYVSNLASVADIKTRDEIRRFFTQKGNFRNDVKPPLDDSLERIDANIRFIKVNEER